MAPKSSRANAMILSVLVLVLTVQPVFAEEEKTLVELATGTVDKDLIEYDRKFSVIFPQQAIIDRLNIRPDMTIVDIGAGAGRFTFHLADALKGTGKVYATEINPQLVEYLKKKSEEEGYKNITIVTVSSAGVDQFYRGRTFDIIFLGGMLLFLRSPDDYLRDLRPSLALNGGRLCIVEPASLLRFNRFNLSDVTDVVSMLAKKGDDFPVLKLLSEEARVMISNYQGQDILQSERDTFVNDLNSLLSHRFLFTELVNYYFEHKPVPYSEAYPLPYYLFSQLDRQDVELVKFLIEYLEADMVFDDIESELDERDKEFLARLNKILLINLLKIDPRINELEHGIGRPIFKNKKYILSVMRSAGYELVADHTDLPDLIFLEFKRKE